MPAAIASHRIGRVLLAAALAATGVLIGRASFVRGQDDAFADAFFVETSYLATYDHAILWVFEEVDPTSVPDPADFRVWIGDPAVSEPVLDVDFVYQGLVGVLPELPQGTSFIELSWASDVPNGTAIRFDYTPGAHPIRDLAGNEMPAVSNVELELLDVADIGPIPFVDEGAGPDTMVVFFPEPLQPDLPSHLDFEYLIDGVGHAVAAIERREAHLGGTFLYLTLDEPIDPTTGPHVVRVTYRSELTPGSPPLRDRNGEPIDTDDVDENGDPVVGFSREALVTLSATPTRQTDVGNVTVAPADETTGAQLATITFDNVTVAGSTTLTTTETAPPLPAGFSVGDPPTYYEIETTATFTGSVTVCIRYGAADYPLPVNLTLLHHDGTAWVPALNQSVDEPTQTICGEVTHLSPFAVAQSAYAFDGFFSPVDNAPTVNVTNAGQAIPVRFSLGGNFGLSILVGIPVSRGVACDSGAPIDLIEQTVSTNGPALSYAAGTDRYQLVWKTNKAWAGSCRELVLSFADGSQQSALFRFK